MIRALRRFKDPMAAPPYLSLFKLREAPFAPSADARFFYSDPERAQTLNMLQHLTQYSEELLLVCGPAGAGKSSLLEQYLSRADDDWKVCRVSAGEVADPAALFLAAARCFGLVTDGISSDQLLGALQTHLNQLQQSMMPVLVVDDAQHLSDDALEIVVRLAELPGEHGRLVRVILFAENAILQRFGSPRFSSAPQPHVLELKPLDEGQTIAYLQHRLGTAGYAGGPLFQPRELKRIHKQSAGWPAGINAMAHEVLMSKQKAGRPSPWRIITLGALAAGAAAGGYLMLGGHSAGEGGNEHTPALEPVGARHEQPIVRVNEQPKAVQTALVVRSGETLQITCTAPSATAAAEVSAPASLPLLHEAAPAAVETRHEEPAAPQPDGHDTEVGQVEETVAAAAEDKATVGEHAAGAESERAAAPAAVVPEHAPDAALTAPHESAAAEAAVVPVPIIETIEPNPVPASGGRQKVTVRGKNFTANSEVTVSGKGRRRTLPADQVQIIDAQQVTIEFNPGMSAAELSVTIAGADGRVSEPFQFKVEPSKPAVAAAPEPAPEPVLAASAMPAPNAEQAAKPALPEVPTLAGFRSAAWLREQEPQRFTVQLVGATTEQAIREHLHGYNVTGDIALLVTERGGKPWYVVFWGNFSSREEAKSIVATLPADLRKAGPWIRPFRDVHKELASAR